MLCLHLVIIFGEGELAGSDEAFRLFSCAILYPTEHCVKKVGQVKEVRLEWSAHGIGNGGPCSLSFELPRARFVDSWLVNNRCRAAALEREMRQRAKTTSFRRIHTNSFFSAAPTAAAVTLDVTALYGLPAFGALMMLL